MARVLKRPSHGWAQTRTERFMNYFSALPLMLIAFSWLSICFISVFGMTVVTVELIVNQFQ